MSSSNLFSSEKEKEYIIPFNLEVVQNFEPTKEFAPASICVTDLSTSSDGLEMILAADDNKIVYYNMESGRCVRNVPTDKYGVNLVQHVGNKHCIHSSTRIDNNIRYLSLTETKYIRYYMGHTADVNTVQTNPRLDLSQFISSANDKTIRFWDLRSQSTTGFLHFRDIPICSYDPEGILFAVAVGNHTIYLFDVRSFDCGSFKKFEILHDFPDAKWKRIDFSPCGKLIIISTNTSKCLVIDAFSGKLKWILESSQHPNPNIYTRCSFTPDSKYICVGNYDRSIHFYSTNSGEMELKMKTTHIEGPHLIAFGKNSCHMTSVSKRMLLWSAPDEYIDKVKIEKS
ncbi:unnamed protein product [Caenorhabditis angaria]|uniref:Uncharacterized protein n=1 Tax=Caenorhabditis angaria TaxID=860376 RepID=A0A9P1IAE0_9PELO|nr:unnamed protein product [Caenorhabditis angaria]